MIGNFTQPNNCPIPVTWFTLVQGSDCFVVQNRYQRGDELATHTATHIQLNETTSAAIIDREIGGGKEFLTRGCLLPAQDIVGFRSTYLVTNPTTRQVSSLFILSDFIRPPLFSFFKDQTNPTNFFSRPKTSIL